jgi:hypothetical protein
MERSSLGSVCSNKFVLNQKEVLPKSCATRWEPLNLEFTNLWEQFCILGGSLGLYLLVYTNEMIMVGMTTLNSLRVGSSYTRETNLKI